MLVVIRTLVILLIILPAIFACSRSDADHTDFSCWTNGQQNQDDEGNYIISAIASVSAGGNNVNLLSDRCPYEEARLFSNFTEGDTDNYPNIQRWNESISECGADGELDLCYYRVLMRGTFSENRPDEAVSCYAGIYFLLSDVEQFDAISVEDYTEIFRQAEEDWQGEVPEPTVERNCVY
jgi:hypothetical protein